MKLTEQDFKEYFPKDNRFLHFCAKYYGLSFFSDEVVEEASFIALKNVMKMYNDQREFDDEKHKTGMVMSAFRFGILNAYKETDRRNRLPVSNESTLTYGDGSDEYNKFLTMAVSNDKEYDNLNTLLHDFIDNNLNHLEKAVIKEQILGESTYKMMSSEHGVTINALRLAKERAIRKLRNYVRAINSTEHIKKEEADRPKYVSQDTSRLRVEILLESARKEQEKRDRYRKALSYVYLDE